MRLFYFTRFGVKYNPILDLISDLVFGESPRPPAKASSRILNKSKGVMKKYLSR